MFRDHVLLSNFESTLVRSDGDEPLQSGSGVVSKDVTDENLLDSWRDAMGRWHQNLKQRPKQVQSLARKGIPEALRGEVWQLLAGCTDNSDMLDAYRILIAKVRIRMECSRTPRNILSYQFYFLN